MFRETNVKDLTVLNGERIVVHELPDSCPRCNRGIQPHLIDGVYYPSSCGAIKLSVHYYCQLCLSCFMTSYTLNPNDDSVNGFKVFYNGFSEPTSFVGTEFSAYISNLSPQFVEIYHQSENAEAIGLNQISGMGYRKALEFLVKDYAIHKNPDKKNEIEKAFLSACIKNYIENPKIQTLAEKSAWLGNNETHYVKEHMDRNVSDLKIFIKACANYIEMDLTVEDAGTIQDSRSRSQPKLDSSECKETS